ncbi:hypothetical protein Vadar_016735 [Vaccinium darrowii]|uniref:Uncharacterized protein n=1 Tax=Vaccinium darrowii TaxID=229202 RepID=A0ACB7YM12_9ERIC|nr:hypothetical protein Vadar_016735 [Vaccinium darrowii]
MTLDKERNSASSSSTIANLERSLAQAFSERVTLSQEAALIPQLSSLSPFYFLFLTLELAGGSKYMSDIFGDFCVAKTFLVEKNTPTKSPARESSGNAIGGIKKGSITSRKARSRSCPPRSPIITRSVSAAMGDERSRLVGQENPKTVPWEEYEAMKKEMDALQAMVTSLLAAQAHHQSSSSTPYQPGARGFVLQEQKPQLGFIPIGTARPPPQENWVIKKEEVYPPPPTREENSPLAQKVQHMEEALRTMQGPSSYTPTSFANLYFFPDLQLPPKFKMPNFSKFDGTTDPISHLKLYAGALFGYPNPDKVMVQLFQHSLKGQGTDQHREIGASWHLELSLGFLIPLEEKLPLETKSLALKALGQVNALDWQWGMRS